LVSKRDDTKVEKQENPSKQDKEEEQMLNEIVTIYSVIDDFLKAIGHKKER